VRSKRTDHLWFRLVTLIPFSSLLRSLVPPHYRHRDLNAIMKIPHHHTTSPPTHHHNKPNHHAGLYRKELIVAAKRSIKLNITDSQANLIVKYYDRKNNGQIHYESFLKV
jgi:hypothetical protein